jgi:hypothetical protein
MKEEAVISFNNANNGSLPFDDEANFCLKMIPVKAVLDSTLRISTFISGLISGTFLSKTKELVQKSSFV